MMPNKPWAPPSRIHLCPLQPPTKLEQCRPKLQGQHHTELGCTPNLPDHKRQPVCCCVFKGGCCCSFEGLHVVLVSCCGGCCCSCFCNVTRTAPRFVSRHYRPLHLLPDIVAIVIVACNICIVTGRVCTIFSSIFPSTPIDLVIKDSCVSQSVGPDVICSFG